LRLLLLAGTREARELSFALDGIDLVSSLAGVTQRPAQLGGEMRVGGFGGVSGLVSYLRSENIDAVIDATHPFAAQMSHNAAASLMSGSHVFLATGRSSLDHFKSRPDVEFTTRVIDDKPPFSVEEELETLQDLGVASLVARNSGGTGGIEKVIAAERLGVEVVMVERPVLPETLRSASVEEALQMMEANGWLAG